jgi:hypothetical protein
MMTLYQSTDNDPGLGALVPGSRGPTPAHQPKQTGPIDYICVLLMSGHPQRNTSGSSRFAVSISPARVAGCRGAIG